MLGEFNEAIRGVVTIYINIYSNCITRNSGSRCISKESIVGDVSLNHLGASINHFQRDLVDRDQPIFSEKLQRARSHKSWIFGGKTYYLNIGSTPYPPKNPVTNEG